MEPPNTNRSLFWSGLSTNDALDVGEGAPYYLDGHPGRRLDSVGWHRPERDRVRTLGRHGYDLPGVADANAGRGAWVHPSGLGGRAHVSGARPRVRHMAHLGDRVNVRMPSYGRHGPVLEGIPEWAPGWGSSGVPDGLYLRQALQGETLERSGAFAFQHPKLAPTNAIPRFWGRLIRVLRGPGPWRFEWHDEVPQGAMQARDHTALADLKLDEARFSWQRDPEATPRLCHRFTDYEDRAGVPYT